MRKDEIAEGRSLERSHLGAGAEARAGAAPEPPPSPRTRRAVGGMAHDEEAHIGRLLRRSARTLPPVLAEALRS